MKTIELLLFDNKRKQELVTELKRYRIPQKRIQIISYVYNYLDRCGESHLHNKVRFSKNDCHIERGYDFHISVYMRFFSGGEDDNPMVECTASVKGLTGEISFMFCEDDYFALFCQDFTRTMERLQGILSHKSNILPVRP